MAFETRSGAPIMGPAFNDPTSGVTAIAQAEVYNAQWYDLYTQNWRAKLTPGNLVTDAEHIGGLADASRQSALFKDLINKQEAAVVNVH